MTDLLWCATFCMPRNLQPEPDPDDKARWILVQTDPYGNSTLDCSKCHTRIFLTNDSRKPCTCPGCGRTMED